MAAADTIPLPPDDQAADERTLYVGTWIGEVRQPIELKGRPNAVLREIWVRLPSGKDKKWRTNEDVFSALEGHQVGALVGPSSQPDQEFLIGMVNFSTGEKRVFWTSNQPGCGCVLWVILFAMLGFAQRAADVWLYAWAVAFLIFAAVTFLESRKISRLRKRDKARLDYLATNGADVDGQESSSSLRS